MVYSDSEVTRFVHGGVRDADGTRQRVSDLIAYHDRHGVSAADPWARGRVAHEVGDSYRTRTRARRELLAKGRTTSD